MPIPDGPQFVTLYRGLQGVKPDKVKSTGLGTIWSTQAHIAKQYAKGSASDSPEGASFGSVIRAKVPVEHISEGTPSGDRLQEVRLHPDAGIDIEHIDFEKQRGSTARWGKHADAYAPEWLGTFPRKATS